MYRPEEDDGQYYCVSLLATRRTHFGCSECWLLIGWIFLSKRETFVFLTNACFGLPWCIIFILWAIQRVGIIGNAGDYFSKGPINFTCIQCQVYSVVRPSHTQSYWCVVWWSVVCSCVIVAHARNEMNSMWQQGMVLRMSTVNMCSNCGCPAHVQWRENSVMWHMWHFFGIQRFCL